MKKIFSVVLCLVIAFSCIQLPAVAMAENNATPRLTHIYDATVSIGKSGSSVRVTGTLSCRSSSVTFCTINVSIYSRDKGSSDSWTHEKTYFGRGSYYCSAYGDLAIDSTKEYRGRIYCTAHPTDGSGLEHLTLYTETYTPGS